MDVLIPVLGLDNRGGTRVSISLANGLSTRGHHVEFVVPYGTVTTTFSINSEVNIREVGFRIPQIEDLSSIIRTAMLFGSIPKADIVIANYYLTAFPALFAHSTNRVRNVIYFIQAYEPIVFGEEERTFPKFKKIIAESTYRLPFHQITVSNWLAGQVEKISGKPLRVFYPGIDTAIFSPGKRDRKKATRLLIFPSHDRYKGWQDFVDAFYQLKKEQNEIQVIAASRNQFSHLNNEFRAVHPANDYELVEIYQQADVYIHPSWYEACPLSPLEAMACGTPVIAAASEGVKEYAVDGYNCLLVPPKNPQALSSAISRLLSDQTLQEKLRSGGLETVTKFSWDRTIDELEKYFLEILDGKQ